MLQRAADADIVLTATALEHGCHAERSLVCSAARSSAGHYVCEVFEDTKTLSGRRRDIKGDAPSHWARLHISCIVRVGRPRHVFCCRDWLYLDTRSSCGVAGRGSRRLHHE